MDEQERAAKARAITGMLIEISAFYHQSGQTLGRLSAIGMPVAVAKMMGLVPGDVAAEMAKITPQSGMRALGEVDKLAEQVIAKERPMVEALGGEIACDGSMAKVFEPITEKIMALMVPDSEVVTKSLGITTREEDGDAYDG